MAHVPHIMMDKEADQHMAGDHDIDNDMVDGDSPTGPGDGNGDAPIENNALLSKTKRIACTICRRRKLRCNGARPSCSTCSRLGHKCLYDEVRRKSGPKRGYVKALEERLKQVETMLRTREGGSRDETDTIPQPQHQNQSLSPQNAANPGFGLANGPMGLGTDKDMDRWLFNPESPQPAAVDELNNFVPTLQLGGMNGMNNFAWEMIGLGLKEPLPAQEIIDQLHHIYFTKVHPTVPMIHRPRYLAAMDLAPNQRPPVALRYAMWTLACAISDEFAHFQDLFYRRARKYVEDDASRGFGEHIVSTAMAQTHVLLTLYEFRMMYFPRAWMSTGSAVRLCQMMGLHRIDGAALEVKACAPPPQDWTEREERRRTFWMAFCMDKYASIGTGWPMTIDERDVTTHLPASDQAFNLSRPEQTQSLSDSLTPQGAARLSSFGGTALMACLFGRNLTHLHRPDAEDNDCDLNGAFWKRHRQLDNILLNTTLCMPQSMRLPDGMADPNVVWTAMCIHTSTICLHQAAIFKADKNRLPSHIGSESKIRCIAAANETASIMRMISHTDTSAANPFLAFSLYVAARVFVQYLKSRPDDSQTMDSLSFLLTAMAALKRRNPFTESFLVQLDVDVESLVAKVPELRSKFHRTADQETWQRLGDRGKINTINEPSGTRSCNHMSLSDELPDFNTAAYPTSTGVGNVMPFDAVNRGDSASASGHSHLHDEHVVGARLPDTSPSPNRPTPNSSIASDYHNHTSGTATYPPPLPPPGAHSHLSPGSSNVSGRSFNASPASSHHNLSFDPSTTNTSNTSSSSSATTTTSNSNSSFFANIPLFGQNLEQGQVPSMQMQDPSTNQNQNPNAAAYHWIRELVGADPQAAPGMGTDPTSAAVGLMNMAPGMGGIDMAWPSGLP